MRAPGAGPFLVRNTKATPIFFGCAANTRVISPLFLYVRQAKGLRTHFPDVWQGKDLAEMQKSKRGIRLYWEGREMAGSCRRRVRSADFIVHASTEFVNCQVNTGSDKQGIEEKRG